MVTRLEQTHAHHECGTHTGRCAYGRFSAFHGGESALKTGDGGVGRAGVGIAVFRACKTPCRGFCIGLQKAAGQIQRFRVFAVLAGVYGNTHGERVAVQIVRKFSGCHA